VKNPDSTAEFKPVVKLETVDKETLDKIKGKEEELWKHRSMLYLFSKDKASWITRGKGNIKMIKKDISPFIVLVHNEEKTFKLRLSTIIHPNSTLSANMGSDRAWTFSCEDYSINEPDESGNVKPEVAQFAVKFKTPEIAQEFKKKYEECQAANVKTAASLKKEASVEEPKEEPKEAVKEEEPAKKEEEEEK